MRVVVQEALGAPARDPIIRAVSTAYVFRPLGYLAEFALGKGRLIVSALSLDQKLPEARCLLAGIVRYASGKQLAAAPKLTLRGLENIVKAGRLGDPRP